MTALDLSAFEKRKQEHIELALQNAHQTMCADLDKLELIHEAMPEQDFSAVTISIESLAKELSTPFFVSSMTAGHHGAININLRLAEACAETGWAFAVGSQRREISDPNAAKEWLNLRAQFPALRIYGNIGLTQVITHSVQQIEALCEPIAAEALFIHCNPLQECIQPEGTPQFAGGLKAVAALCKAIKIPIIIKETGCGFSAATLQRLMNTGIAAVDVSGFGGTHWGRIEGARTHNFAQKQTAECFQNWGISTLQSILNAKHIQFNREIWASGGVRSGLDAAKYLALGANRIGIAKPMLEAALISTAEVVQLMQSMEYQLKTALFCTGSQNIAALREPHRWQLKI